jgi:uracil-DNA glycosylase
MTITQKQTCQYGRFFCNYFLKLTRGILGVKVDGGFIMSFSMQNSWSSLLEKGLQTPAMRALEDFLAQEIAQGKIIHPQSNEYFRALDLTPIQDVKVVILGQDPYHGEGQAHGLSFSVAEGVKIPPSLANIYKELRDDLDIMPAESGLLERWAVQGVLLLNSVLSVEDGRAASHRDKGWEAFTDEVIHSVNAQEKPVVFLLWGSFAQKKASFVDESKHLVLKAVHPSPLSAYRGFFGCKHFSQANKFLEKHGRGAVSW